MEKFKELVAEMEISKIEADKLYIKDNMEAGKRLFESLMSIQRKCKAARVELSQKRKEIRASRKYGI